MNSPLYVFGRFLIILFEAYSTVSSSNFLFLFVSSKYFCCILLLNAKLCIALFDYLIIWFLSWCFALFRSVYLDCLVIPYTLNNLRNDEWIFIVLRVGTALTFVVTFQF